MSFLKRFVRPNSAPAVQGQIGYYGLAEWWLASFTSEERAYIEDQYKPLGETRSRPLTEGLFQGATRGDGVDVNATDFLTGLAGWLNNKQDRRLAKLMLTKAESLSADSRVLTRHFLFSQMVDVYYPDRDSDPEALATAIRACEKQIELAPAAIRAFKQENVRSNEILARFKEANHEPNPVTIPAHRGYKQLCIIRERERDYAEAIRLARQAMKQGWMGDWGKRIARCEKKLAKAVEG